MRSLMVAAFVAIAVGVMIPVEAATIAWQGGTNGNATTWATAGNWNPTGVPTSTDAASFSNAVSGATKNGTPTLLADATVGELMFSSTSAYTLGMSGGAWTLTLNGLGTGTLVGISNSGSMATGQVISANLKLGAAQSWINSPTTTANTFTVSGAVNNNGVLLTLDGTGTGGFISGIISGGGGLTKTGSGTWTLQGANIYTGTTSVSMGTLQLGATNALPTSGSVSVSSGATLDIHGFDTTIGALSGVSGSVVSFGSTPGTLTISGLSTYAGSMGTSLAPGKLSVTASTTQLSGGANVQLSSTSVSGGSTLQFTSSGSSLGAISLGSGTLGLSGSVSSTSWSFAGGTLRLDGTVGTSGAHQTLSLLGVSSASTINFNGNSGILEFTSLPSSTSAQISISGYTYASGTREVRADTTNGNVGLLTSIFAGTSWTWDSSANNYLLTSAIPEPGTWAAIAGIAGLGVAVYRRRRAAAAAVNVAVTAEV